MSIIENVCHGIHQYESAHVNFKEFLYFSLFSSVTSAALNTIQISYGISYFRHRDSSDIFTYDIARQSVVDKMVRESSLEVREKSGKSQGILFSHFCGNPAVAPADSPVEKILTMGSTPVDPVGQEPSSSVVLSSADPGGCWCVVARFGAVGWVLL